MRNPLASLTPILSTLLLTFSLSVHHTNAQDTDGDGVIDPLECDVSNPTFPLATLNPSFELPIYLENTGDDPGNNPNAVQAFPFAGNFNQTDVLGWSTTAVDNLIEIGRTANQVPFEPPTADGQYAEINANEDATLFQDIQTTPGDIITYSFAHKGRSAVADVMDVLLGAPPGLPGDAPTVVEDDVTTDNTAWQFITGTYTVPAAQTVTRVQFKAVITGSGDNAIGNFLDAVSFRSCGVSSDNDPLANSDDIDSDDDGISDAIEYGVDTSGVDFNMDSDGDGIPDAMDASTGGTDANNNGVIDSFDPVDTDGDGIVDMRDLDSDNDGIYDVVEAGFGSDDTNGDGRISSTPATDGNQNGQVDFYETRTPRNTVSTTPPDYINTDSDGDGCSDADEAYFGSVTDADSDNDGLYGSSPIVTDAVNGTVNGAGYDASNVIYFNANFNSCLDTDGDGVPDSADLDDDNDGIPDTEECPAIGTTLLPNGDFGVANVGTDPFSNGSGSGSGNPDNFDTYAMPFAAGITTTYGFKAPRPTDGNYALVTNTVGFSYSSGQPIPNFWLDIEDLTSDAPGELGYFALFNADGSPGTVFEQTLSGLTIGETYKFTTGIINLFDPGYLSNGTAQFMNTTPIAPNISLTVQDGAGAIVAQVNSGDIPNDGQWKIVDLAFEATATDVTLIIGSNTAGGFGNDFGIDGISLVQVCDTDGDGIPNNLDLDSDNDGIPDITEAGGTDTDGDGRIDYPTPGDPTSMVDTNNDGLDDGIAASPLPNPDSDNDGIDDVFDLDSDNDGLPDVIEAGGTDANGDGIIDGFTDTDADGLADSVDPVGPATAGTPLPNFDSDNDGVDDRIDLDSDNDGITDVTEAGGPDTDGDGRIDGFTDTDNDGFADSVDPVGPATAGTPLPDPDTDNDGVDDRIDVDSDNDGITDVTEAGGPDTDGDGRIDGFTDTDNDGLADSVDPVGPAVAGTPLPRDDFDNDGRPNYLDIDSDNDGITDTTEAGGLDANGDGQVDGFTDAGNDGLDDAVAADPLPIPNSDSSTVDGPDYLDIDADNDGLPDNIEAQPTEGYVAPNGVSAANGLDTAYTTGFVPENTDGDAIPDYRDTDSDDDGIDDLTEGGRGTLTDVDTDGDGLDDGFEGNELNDPVDVNDEIDDPTTLPDAQVPGGEVDYRQTLNVDSDGDGVLDQTEIAEGTDPSDPCDLVAASITEPRTGDWSNADCDGDGVTNGQEIIDGTNPDDPCDFNADNATVAPSAGYLIADCDGDGVTNGDELTDGTDPSDPCNFLAASVTLERSGDWLTADCDGDTIPNGQEVTDGTDPDDPCSSRGGTPPAGSACDIEIESDLVRPNRNDGIFRINNIESFPNNTVRIYNRWGVLVYSTDQYDNRDNVFRGVSNGRAVVQQKEELPVGVYYYVVDYVNNQQALTKSGYLYVDR